MAQQRDGARSRHSSSDDMRRNSLLRPFARTLSPRQVARIAAAIARCPFAELHQELARAEQLRDRDPASAAAAAACALVALERAVSAAVSAATRSP